MAEYIGKEVKPACILGETAGGSVYVPDCRGSTKLMRGDGGLKRSVKRKSWPAKRLSNGGGIKICHQQRTIPHQDQMLEENVNNTAQALVILR